MNTVSYVVWSGVAILALGITAKINCHILACRAVRAHFKKMRMRVTRISKSIVFLDLCSASKAITSSGYDVIIESQDDKQKAIFCLVRQLPIIGYVFDIEIWKEEDSGKISPKPTKTEQIAVADRH